MNKNKGESMLVKCLSDEMLAKTLIPDMVISFLENEYDYQIMILLKSYLRKFVGTNRFFVKNQQSKTIDIKATIYLLQQKIMNPDFEVPDEFLYGLVVSINEIVKIKEKELKGDKKKI